MVLIMGCGSPNPPHHRVDRCKANYSQQDQTNYDVFLTETTETNIIVDTSGLSVDLKTIDRLVNEADECLLATFGNPVIIPDDVIRDGKCISNTFELPIKRDCLVVKIASDWHLSQYEYGGSKHQLLPYTNGGNCTYKGLPDGVCYWRAGIQDNLTIVVPPSMYLLKDPLVKITTGCKDPWYAPKLAKCMTPTTNPL